jgi:glycosyltransferase involved in cell wall biosynthesis
MTTISVALPTYNGGRYLRPLLDSLLAQSRLPDEIIICDDDSDDGTVLIAEEYAEEYPSLFEVYSFDSTRGPFQNFQRAFQRCSGDFIAICDQDDVWATDKIERQADRLAKNNDALLCYHDSKFYDENLESIGLTLWELHDVDPSEHYTRESLACVLARRNFIQGASMMIRSSHLQNTLPLPELVPYDHWVALVAHCHAPVEIIDEPLLKWRRHSNTDTGMHAENLKQDLFHRIIVSLYSTARNPVSDRVQFVNSWRDRMDEFTHRFDKLDKKKFTIDPQPVREELHRRQHYFELRHSIRICDISEALWGILKLFRERYYRDFGSKGELGEDIWDVIIGRHVDRV